MAAPSQPAGTSASAPVEQGKPPTLAEQPAKQRADGTAKSPHNLKKQGHKAKIAEGVKSLKKKSDRDDKQRQLEDVEKMLEEREEVKTAATVFYGARSTDKPGTTHKAAQVISKIAPFPASPSPHSPRGERSPMSRDSPMSQNLPMSPALPLSPASPKKSPVPARRQESPISMHAPPVYRQKLFVAAVVLLIIAGVSAVFLTVWTTIGPSRKVNYACKTRICEQVMEQIAEYADPTVKPCDDFYSHVCGHWLRMTEGSTFMRDAEKQFIHQRHELLTSPYNSSEPNSNVLETAHAFYKSCLNMFKESVELKTALNEIYSALNVSVKEWLAETRWERFFAQCFDLSLKNHFHTLFKVTRYITAEGPYYYLGLGRSFYRQMRRSNPDLGTSEYMRRVVEKIGETAASNNITQDVVALDSAWQTRLAMKGAPTSPARVADLSCGPFTADVWGARFAVHGASNNAAVQTKNFNRTCAFLEHVLLNTTSQARPLYLLALLASHVLTFDFQVASAGRPDDRTPLMYVCQHAAGNTFEELWLHALSHMLSLKRPYVRDIRNYTDFGPRLRRVISERDWMNAEDRETCLARLDGFRVTVFPDSVMSIQQLECSRFGQGDTSLSRFVLSSTFIKNLVHIFKVELSPSCIRSPLTSMPQSTLDTMLDTKIRLDSKKKTVIVPQFLGTEPLFYVGDVDRYINIATVTTVVASLGATVAKRPVEASHVGDVNGFTEGQWSGATSAKYGDISRCLAENYKLPREKSLSDAEFDDAFAIMDGIKVAKITKDEFDEEDLQKDERYSTATDALFFKRACLSLCASDVPGSHVTEATFKKASAACNYGVGRLKEFHRAFGCTEKNRMWPIMQCSERYTEKQDDVR